ncbi:Uma2 family endonuclease [Nitrosococcus halophilus]|uniref:Uma2 family endonuclease n=1 Tax=Nitrosococcus halophilus TaxID=133539 RepID=UPI00031B0CD3|nr:Uma2 family endonuclease [Nitrosococcus halophilus]
MRLPKSDEADEQTETVVQPDLAVICDSSKLDERGCRGAPDWIIEVLSPATAAKDQIQKRVLYERVGVKEYWTAHPTDKLVTVWLKSGKGTYGKPNIVEGKGMLAVATFPELEINLNQVFVKGEEKE